MSAVLSERSLTTSIDLQSSVIWKNFTPHEQRKTFRSSIDVYLKDSNATGNIYFARHFEWQGIFRERWFYECISSDMLQPIGVFITKEAQQKYLQETFAFQKVDCEINTFAVKQCSFSLLFRFTVGEALVAVGQQQIVFANKDKKIARLPALILEKIRQYEIEHDEVVFTR